MGARIVAQVRAEHLVRARVHERGAVTGPAQLPGHARCPNACLMWLARRTLARRTLARRSLARRSLARRSLARRSLAAPVPKPDPGRAAPSLARAGQARGTLAVAGQSRRGFT